MLSFDLDFSIICNNLSFVIVLFNLKLFLLYLKIYTNSTRHLKYYEENKDTVKERTKKYVEKLKEENPEKLKEWRRTYFLKRKEKLKEANENI